MLLSPGEYKQTDNKFFNWRDKSCLHMIATSNNMVRLTLKEKISGS